MEGQNLNSANCTVEQGIDNKRIDDILNPCTSSFDPLAALEADSIPGKLE